MQSASFLGYRYFVSGHHFRLKRKQLYDPQNLAHLIGPIYTMKKLRVVVHILCIVK